MTDCYPPIQKRVEQLQLRRPDANRQKVSNTRHGHWVPRYARWES